MKSMTRFLSLLLVVVMLIGMLPMGALATEVTGPDATESSSETIPLDTAPAESDPTDSTGEPETSAPEEEATDATESEATESTEVTEVTEVTEETEAAEETEATEETEAAEETEATEAEEEDVALMAVDGEQPVIVFAASDFQGKNSDGKTNGTGKQDGVDTSKATLGAIIDAMKKDGYTNIDGVLFAGDYDVDTMSSLTSQQPVTVAGINAIQEVLVEKGWWDDIDNDSVIDENLHQVYVQGNHDASYKGDDPSQVVEELADLGNNDPASGAYGVWVIHEDNFRGSVESVNAVDPSVMKTDTQNVANNLRNYLEAKLQAGLPGPSAISPRTRRF